MAAGVKLIVIGRGNYSVVVRYPLGTRAYKLFKSYELATSVEYWEKLVGRMNDSYTHESPPRMRIVDARNIPGAGELISRAIGSCEVALSYRYHPGEMLTKRLSTEFDAQSRLKVARELVTLVLGLEKRGLRHNDLSARNILLRSGDDVVVLDWDGVSWFGAPTPPPELESGSVGYVRGKSAVGSDRFALAILVWEVLCRVLERVYTPPALRWPQRSGSFEGAVDDLSHLSPGLADLFVTAWEDDDSVSPELWLASLAAIEKDFEG